MHVRQRCRLQCRVHSYAISSTQSINWPLYIQQAQYNIALYEFCELRGKHHLKRIFRKTRLFLCMCLPVKGIQTPLLRLFNHSSPWPALLDRKKYEPGLANTSLFPAYTQKWPPLRGLSKSSLKFLKQGQGCRCWSSQWNYGHHARTNPTNRFVLK